jgi:hypothetical protein
MHMANEEYRIPEPVKQLALRAITQGLKKKVHGGNMLAFAILNKEVNSVEADFAADSADQSLQMARDAVAKVIESLKEYAIVHDGYLTVNGYKTDALLVEVGVRGDAYEYSFAHRYRPKGFLRRMRLIGNPALVGRTNGRFEKVTQ